ncbi:HEAT repeat-containing protein [Methanocella conradii HZ254]|uniref:HEAT repeat-containing protein n=1 Tax=Methanocella conradii (strain DSM 24694 / JCM 17849 / CGMCC 1.5162 / HZ254) TaxID=1041930 RepID=H8I858_METCZ|nr:HEAT repeat domain-containing protein [Methanocella conradii]AFD00876.1 HEAT repeat-containing protein [Methanocella conradii HZ254]
MMIESMHSKALSLPHDEMGWRRQTLAREDINARISAVKTLEMRGGRQSINLLAEALKDESYEVRESAYHAICRLGYEAMPEMVRALKDESFYARMYAALAISNMVTKEPDKKYGDDIIDALAQALLDKSIYVRRSAYDALKVLEYNKVFKSLIGSLESPDAGIRLEAIIALGRIGDKRSMKALIRALYDEDANVRKCAIIALGRIRDKKAVSLLSGALSDPDGGVRKEAAKALGSIGGPRAVSSLIQALNDMEPSVRDAAREALSRINKSEMTRSCRTLKGGGRKPGISRICVAIEEALSEYSKERQASLSSFNM